MNKTNNIQLLQELIPAITTKYIELDSCKYCGIFTVSQRQFEQKRCKYSKLSPKHFNAFTCVECRRSVCKGCEHNLEIRFVGKSKCCRQCFMRL